MRIQFVTQWIKRHRWGPIPNEWFLLEGFVQAGLARVNSGPSRPQHRYLPLQLSCDSPNIIDLNNIPKDGYDLTFVMSTPNYIGQLMNLSGYKVGITFDLPSFTPDRYSWFKGWARQLDLVFETSKDELPTETILVRQGVRKGAPFISSLANHKRCAFFGRKNRRSEWAEFLEHRLKCNFYETIKNGVFDEDLWDILRVTDIVFGAPGKPFYWSNRIYKMIEIGGCFVTPYIEGLEEEFVNDVHIIWRNTLEEIAERIERLSPREIGEFKYQSWKIGQEKYTYCHSAEKMIAALKDRGVL